jgi:hypothetical protein
MPRKYYLQPKGKGFSLYARGGDLSGIQNLESVDKNDYPQIGAEVFNRGISASDLYNIISDNTKTNIPGIIIKGMYEGYFRPILQVDENWEVPVILELVTIYFNEIKKIEHIESRLQEFTFSNAHQIISTMRQNIPKMSPDIPTIPQHRQSAINVGEVTYNPAPTLDAMSSSELWQRRIGKTHPNSNIIDSKKSENRIIGGNTTKLTTHSLT